MAYSVYNLNNRINYLQNEINNGGGGGGDASLTANQTFTGINTFDNATNIANTPNASHTVNLGNINATTTIKGSILNNDAPVYNIGFNQLGEVNIKGTEINVEGSTNINTIGDFDTTIGNFNATTTKINGAIDLDATSIIAKSDLNMNQNDITNVLSIQNTSAPISLLAPSGLSLNSTVGTTNQYLGSNESGQPTWKTLPAGVNPSLSDVLSLGGNSAGSTDINMNQNDITNVLSIQNTSAPISLLAPSGLSLNSTVGTTDQYLGSNASGQPTWKTLPAGVNPTFNNVLIAGNTTTQTATFNDINGVESVIVKGNRVQYTYTSTDPADSSTTKLDNFLTVKNTATTNNSSISYNRISLFNNVDDIASFHDVDNFTLSKGANTAIISESSSLTIDKLNFFKLGDTNTDCGIQKNGTALQLNTNGTLKLNGLTGSTDQVLKYNSSGNAVWSDPTIPTLNSVLGSGNTTTNSASFTSGSGPTLETTTIEGSGITYSNLYTNAYVADTITMENLDVTEQTNISKTQIDILDLNSNDTTTIDKNSISLEHASSVIGISDNTIKIDNTTISPFIEIVSDTRSKLEKDKLTFTFGTPSVQNAGLSIVSNGLQLNTNGTLKLNGLTGSTDNVLKLNSSGNAFWGTAGGNQSFNDVLVVSNTTTNSAIFNGTSTNTNTIGGDSVVFTDGSTSLTVNKTGITTRNSVQTSDHFLTFVDTSTTGVSAIQKTAGIKVIPSSNTIYATTFNGNLTGTASNATDATNATNVNLTSSGASATTFYPTFVTTGTGNKALNSYTGLSYVPSTGTLTATNFNGNLTGTVSNATNATFIATTSDTTTNASFFPTFVPTSSTGNQAEKVSSGLSFNPSSNTLTTSNYIGNSLQRSAVGALTIGNNSNTTSMTIGGGTVGTTIDMGVIGSRTGLIKIGTGSGSGNVEIGSTSGTVTINGTLSNSTYAPTTVNTTNVNTQTIDYNGVGGQLVIGGSSTTTSMSLGTGITTGNIDIGIGLTSGDVNIATGNLVKEAGCAVNIGTGGTIANTIAIGSATSLTTVGGTLGVGSTVTAPTFSGALSGNATSATTIATTADTTTTTAQYLPFVPLSTTSTQAEKINSNLTFIASSGTLGSTIISTPTVNSTGSGNSLALGGNITTGSINIGTALTDGDVNIATSTTTKLAGCAVNIGTGGSVANTVNIGASTSVTTIGSDLTLSAGKGIKAGTVPASTVAGGTLYNKAIYATATVGGAVTFTANYIGDTQYAYLSSNSTNLATGETTILTINLVKTGVYAMSWFANYKNAGTASRTSSILTYLRTGNSSSVPTVAGGYSIPYQAQYANFQAYYPTPINFSSSTGYSGSTTAFLQGNETGLGGSGIVDFQTALVYSVGPTDLQMQGGLLANCVIITRIA